MKNSRTIVTSRRSRILELLREKGDLEVQDLSAELGVSLMTIRRDVSELEAEGAVERFHGGARLPQQSVSVEEDTALSMSFYPGRYKDAIARAAAALVEDGDSLFMNSGTTTLAVLKYLNNRPVRVITNNALASIFMEDAQMELILTGGRYRHASMALVGDLAISNLTRFYASKCILGAKGVSFERGVTTHIQTGTAINDMMLNQLRGTCIIVADGSKIGKSYDFVNIGIEKVNILITDQTADKAEIRRIRAAGVQVIIVDA